MSNMFTLLLLFLAAAIGFYVGLIVGRALNSDSELISELERENAALREQLEYAIKASAKREADLLVMVGKEAQP